MSQLYAERGSTSFEKVRLQRKPLALVENDFKFAISQLGGTDIPYGTAGDCYSVQADCRKGSFKVCFKYY